MFDSDAYYRPLTARQQRFAHEYCLDGNATAAARRAGYSSRKANAAANTGARLLKHPEVQAIIEDAYQSRQVAIGNRVTSQAKEFQARATVSISEYLKICTDGSLRFKTLDELSSFQVDSLERVDVAQDGATCAIKLKNPTDAINNLLRIVSI